MAMNRFAWETAAKGRKNFERRRAALTFYEPSKHSAS
ncbi:MAG: hypothetical protein ACTS5I_03940 [Rhodanobacter sp.]